MELKPFYSECPFYLKRLNKSRFHDLPDYPNHPSRSKQPNVLPPIEIHQPLILIYYNQ